MIIDNLFENNKKPLNEVDPRNFDSDEDYYNAVKQQGQQQFSGDWDVWDEIASLENQIKYANSSALAHQLYKQINQLKQQAGIEDDEDEYEKEYDADIRARKGVAEARAASASFRSSNKKRAELNDMTPEERKAYDKEQAEKQRKRDDARLEKERQKLASKKKDNVAESRRYKLEESRILKGSTYNQFRQVGRLLAERKMSEKEILDVFAQAEQGMTNSATGANRTALGRGKDVVGRGITSAKDAITGVLDSIQNSAPVAGVDVAYDQATDALANIAGGQSGKIMDTINKYRLLAKEYPKTQLFVKTALIALAGLATGGAGLPVIAGLTAAVDAAIKGEKLSSIIGKGTGAGLMGMGAQEVNELLSTPSASTDVDPSTGEVPVDASLAPGEEVVSTDAATDTSTGLAGQFAGGQYTVQNGDQLGYIAQANGVSAEDIKGLNPHINWAKPLQPGMTIDLPPTGDGAGSVWQGYNGGVYGDKAAMSQAQADALSGRTDNLANMQTSAGGSAVTPKSDATATSNNAAGTDEFYNTPNAGLDEPVPAGYEQGVAYDQDGNLMPGWTPTTIDGKKWLTTKESINFKTIPADQLIDQKLTVLGWALNESVNREENQSVHLTNKGVYTVFENVDRYRKAILEAAGPGRAELPDYYRPDAPGAPAPQTAKPGMIGRGLNWLDKKAGQVGGALSNFGHQFTTGVTKEKLKMNWHQAGKPTDSDQLAAWLVKQKVPQEVVTDVFSKMGIPYTPATRIGSVSGSINPATNEPWTYAELAASRAARMGTGATANTVAPTSVNTATAPRATPATTTPGANPVGWDNPQSANYVGRREVARRQAAQPAAPAQAKPNYAGPSGYAKTTMNVPTGASMPRTIKPAAPSATPQLSKDEYIKRIGADAQPVAETVKQIKRMMETVTTKADVQRIKDYIDYHMGTNLTEGARLKRNRLLSEVTQLAAVRRREIARQMVK